MTDRKELWGSSASENCPSCGINSWWLTSSLLLVTGDLKEATQRLMRPALAAPSCCAVVLDVYLYLLAAFWTFWDSHVQHRR